MSVYYNDFPNFWQPLQSVSTLQLLWTSKKKKKQKNNSLGLERKLRNTFFFSNELSSNSSCIIDSNLLSWVVHFIFNSLKVSCQERETSHKSVCFHNNGCLLKTKNALLYIGLLWPFYRIIQSEYTTVRQYISIV